MKLTSSDVGGFGINTPTYFALDSLLVAMPEPSTLALLGAAMVGGVAWRRRKWVRFSPIQS